MKAAMLALLAFSAGALVMSALQALHAPLPLPLRDNTIRVYAGDRLMLSFPEDGPTTHSASFPDVAGRRVDITIERKK